jgi:hypothetical protein
MIGRLSPVVGAVTLSSRFTMRSGAESVTGLMAIIGTPGETGMLAALPISAWSRPSTIPVSFVVRTGDGEFFIADFLTGNP